MGSSFTFFLLLFAAMLGNVVNPGNSCNNVNTNNPNCRSSTTIATKTTTDKRAASSPSVPTLTQDDPQTTVKVSTTLKVQTLQTKESKATTTTSPQATTPPAATHKGKKLDINVAYIVAPVVACIIALLLVFGFLWWRRRKQYSHASNKTRGPGSIIQNVVYGVNGIEGTGSFVNVRQSRTNEYAEVELDTMTPDITTGDDYQTIDILPEDKVSMNKSYAIVTQSDSKTIDMSYSHIGINHKQSYLHSDNTYAHTTSTNTSDKSNLIVDDDVDDAYNKLNAITSTTKKVKESEETEYNHAHSGGQNPPHEVDNFSDLGNGGNASRKITKNPRKYDDDEIGKNGNDIGKLRATAKEGCIEYEFAKDVDNLKCDGGMPEYTKVIKQKDDSSKTQIDINGYETAAGTKHNYFILEPEPETKLTSFHVVEDEHNITEEQNGGIRSHEYFILEKI